MAEGQYIFLSQPHRDLVAAINRDGPIECHAALAIWLRSTPDLEGIERRFPLAISCEYDPANPPVPTGEIKHHLEVVAMALQLVRPVDEYSDYWLLFDSEARRIVLQSASLKLPENRSGPPLAYQQHHATRPEDVRRAMGLLPLLSRAMELHHGSWTHPCGSVHRALVFFCQGYSVGLEPLPQLCWAAGLDSLYASKINRRLQGGREISRRLQSIFDPDFEPYNAPTVRVPGNQVRPTRRLRDIGEHIFWLRNACIHGGPIPNAGWLSDAHAPSESGYAYQLMECSEILLRESLLRLLEDHALFETFIDANGLDAYF